MSKSTDYFKDVLTKTPIKTSWLWFFVLIRLPLGIVLGSLSCLSTLGNMRRITAPSDINTALLIILIQLCLVALYVVTYIQMKRLTARGYYLCITTITIDWLAIVVNSNTGYVLTTLVISFLVWSLPNYIYFKKRRELFEPYVLALLEEYGRNSSNNDSAQYNSSEVITAEPEQEIRVYQPYWQKDDTVSQIAQPVQTTQPEEMRQPDNTQGEAGSLPNVNTYLNTEIHQILDEKNIADKSEPQAQQETPSHSYFFNSSEAKDLRSEKVRYCKYCGHQLDSSTNICTGCKKQYFKLKPVHIIAAMAFIIFSMFIYIMILQSQIAKLSR